MMAALETAALWGAALGSGVMAGVYFTFSAFVMRALASLPRGQGAAAMNAINRVILASPFMVLFFGTTVLGLGLAIAGWSQWSAPGAAALLGGGLIYVIGMFVSTAAFNVPLNDALAAADPETSAGEELWARYLQVWTRWNHARTVASLLACALFLAALTAKATGVES